MTDPEPTPDVCPLGPEVYADWRKSDVGTITDRLERRLLLECLGDVTGRRVLDVGCGDGELAVELWRRGAEVVGVDASASMIAAAEERARSQDATIAFQVAPAQHLPFPPESFDTVVAVTILCFVEDAAPAFAEMARVLRPGGRLVIGELGRWSTWALARRLRGWLGSPLWRHGRFRTKHALQRLATNSSLAVETVRGAVYYPRWTWAARLMRGCDSCFGRLGTVGAAFLVLAGRKPDRPD